MSRDGGDQEQEVLARLEMAAPALRKLVGHAAPTGKQRASRNFAMHAKMGCGVRALPTCPREAARRGRGGAAKAGRAGSATSTVDGTTSDGSAVEAKEIEQQAQRLRDLADRLMLLELRVAFLDDKIDGVALRDGQAAEEAEVVPFDGGHKLEQPVPAAEEPHAAAPAPVAVERVAAEPPAVAPVAGATQAEVAEVLAPGAEALRAKRKGQTAATVLRMLGAWSSAAVRGLQGRGAFALNTELKAAAEAVAAAAAAAWKAAAEKADAEEEAAAEASAVAKAAAEEAAEKAAAANADAKATAAVKAAEEKVTARKVTAVAAAAAKAAAQRAAAAEKAEAEFFSRSSRRLRRLARSADRAVGSEQKKLGHCGGWRRGVALTNCLPFFVVMIVALAGHNLHSTAPQQPQLEAGRAWVFDEYQSQAEPEGFKALEAVEEGESELNAEQMRSLHKNFDANGDGKVSFGEVMHFSALMRKEIAREDIVTDMQEMDANKDGKLSWEEVLQDLNQGAEGVHDERVLTEQESFQAADTNGNGFLDVKELPALVYPGTHQGALALATKFALKQKDSNGDGRLTPKEFWEGDAVEYEELAISEEEQADFAKLDKSRDGFLDLEELKAWESGKFHTEQAMQKLFELADRDGDMYVTADELATAREHLAGSDAQHHLMVWAEHLEL